jgi:hypothetical protein
MVSVAAGIELLRRCWNWLYPLETASSTAAPQRARRNRKREYFLKRPERAVAPSAAIARMHRAAAPVKVPVSRRDAGRQYDQHGATDQDTVHEGRSIKYVSHPECFAGSQLATMIPQQRRPAGHRIAAGGRLILSSDILSCALSTDPTAESRNA